MTDKEIKELAREYIEYRYRNYHAENRDRVIEQNTNELYHILKWISSRYCIVSRDKAKAVHADLKAKILSPYKGRVDLDTLFSDLFPDLFTDKNEKQ